jgi:hypothetical protein
VATAGDGVSVLLNTTPKPRPVITSMSPSSGRVGTMVTLVGRHFGDGIRYPVKFGMVSATGYNNWTPKKIEVEVPRGTPKGLVRVRVRTWTGTSHWIGFRRL